MRQLKCKKGSGCGLVSVNVFHAIIYSHSPEDKSPKKAEKHSKRKASGSTDAPQPKIARGVSGEEMNEMNDMKELVSKKYPFFYPDDVLRFWIDLKSAAKPNENPCEILSSVISLRLVGVFELLAGQCDKFEDNIFLVHRRYQTDLPEMETIALSNNGRYAFWRDTPDTKKPLIVFVGNEEHFPKMEIIGTSDPRCIIVHAVGKNVLKDMGINGGSYRAFYKGYIQEASAAKGNRRKNALGKPFHGIGIMVEVKDDVGYRPLPEQNELKKMLQLIATSENESIKETQWKDLMELVTLNQLANDESDFGMGLEFGHNLFWANYPVFDKLATNILKNAYTLLKRETFDRILDEHMKDRRGEPNKLLKNEETAQVGQQDDHENGAHPSDHEDGEHSEDRESGLHSPDPANGSQSGHKSDEHSSENIAGTDNISDREQAGSA